MHLDHVYLFPERRPPADLVIVDCIEFNERFRYADSVADMAFLAMDLKSHGRRDLAADFSDRYFEERRDAAGRSLLPLYISYRAAVRGKVDGLQLAQPEISEEDRAAAMSRARGHWLLALGELEALGRRPGLVLIGGLPGTGKSSLARDLAARANFQVIRSDVVRKELAGLPAAPTLDPEDRRRIYVPDWTDRTYAECLNRAKERLFEGERVIIDATFGDEKHRRAFFDAGVDWGVPVLFLVCRADPGTVKARLAARQGDVSDADWDVYQQAARRWQEPGVQATRPMRLLSTNRSAQAVLEEAGQALAEFRF